MSITTSGELYDVLVKSQGAKGYSFNADNSMTLALLDSLLQNKARYGYMVCPCRLAEGEREKDRDIICPCAYRDADLQEYGRCYCGLYATAAWNAKSEAERENDDVPDRRPVPEEDWKSGGHGEE